jgi:hypothetical protein
MSPTTCSGVAGVIRRRSPLETHRLKPEHSSAPASMSYNCDAERIHAFYNLYKEYIIETTFKGKKTATLITEYIPEL